MPVEFEWMPATPESAADYAETAIKAGHEGWDGSPLWVIRAMIEEHCLIGKLAIKHGAAYVPHNGEEILVEEFEVSNNIFGFDHNDNDKQEINDR